MKRFTVAIAGALCALLAAVQLQYGPEWKVDAAVEAAIARGDLRHARALAATAEHWVRILDAQPGVSDAHASRHGALDVVRERAAGRERIAGDL
jgi:hypothetical protein